MKDQGVLAARVAKPLGVARETVRNWPGSFGYRPKRTVHEAVHRVAEAIVKNKTRVLDLDLRAYFDNVRHHLLLAKVAKRVNDADVMHLLKRG